MGQASNVKDQSKCHSLKELTVNIHVEAAKGDIVKTTHQRRLVDNARVDEVAKTSLGEISG